MEDDIIQLGLIEDEDIELGYAALSLAVLDHEGESLEPYESFIDGIVADLAEVGAHAVTADARAEALSQVLWVHAGLKGDRDTYDDPDNADLMRVIDRRRGLPVSLSILYVVAARRMGWQAHALDVPGHVLVLVGDEAAPIIIDPFREGVRVTPDELAALASRRSEGEISAVRHIVAMPNRAVLVRLLQNQASRAEHAGKAKRALVLYERMTVFAPAYGNAWWERARLELVDGRVDDARSSLSAMLEVTTDRDLRSRILKMLGALGGK